MHLPGLDPRRADLMVAGAVLLDTLLKELDADEITLCDLALREGVLLDYIHRHRKDIARVDRYPDVRRRSVDRAGGAVRVGSRTLEAGDGARVDALRLHEADSRPRRQGARVARVRRLPARHRQPHQLREAPSPFVLPDQERRPARLRAGGDRRDRAPHPLSPPRHAEARAYRVRRSQPRRCAARFRSSRPSCGSPRRSIAAGTASSAASKCASGWASSSSRSRPSGMRVGGVGRAQAGRRARGCAGAQGAHREGALQKNVRPDRGPGERHGRR